MDMPVTFYSVVEVGRIVERRGAHRLGCKYGRDLCIRSVNGNYFKCSEVCFSREAALKMHDNLVEQKIRRLEYAIAELKLKSAAVRREHAR